MRIGAMNHPQHDVVEEIRWMAQLTPPAYPPQGHIDFIDLTLEPPAAASWKVDPGRIKAALDKGGLGVVGHTCYYLPLASPFEEIRQAAVLELKRCLHIFAEVGAKWMNIHPDRKIPMHERDFWVERNLVSLRDLLPASRETGVGLMIENLPEAYNNVATIAPFLEAVPELGLHLDIGHANLLVSDNTTPELLRAYASRVRHVHLHDNKGGGADLHLPLGGGTMDWQRHLRTLKASGYDGTITLEVFTPDRHYLSYSAQRLRAAWTEA